MQYFYQLYASPQLEDSDSWDSLSPQLGDCVLSVFKIPWGHNKLIIDKCKNNREKAIFYANKTLENNWSRAVLMNFLDTDLYERQGKAITNFAMTLPKPESALAQSITSGVAAVGRGIIGGIASLLGF
jgi:hypothetical protein